MQYLCGILALRFHKPLAFISNPYKCVDSHSLHGFPVMIVISPPRYAFCSVHPAKWARTFQYMSTSYCIFCLFDRMLQHNGTKSFIVFPLFAASITVHYGTSWIHHTAKWTNLLYIMLPYTISLSIFCWGYKCLYFKLKATWLRVVELHDSCCLSVVQYHYVFWYPRHEVEIHLG